MYTQKKRKLMNAADNLTYAEKIRLYLIEPE